jgi:hypothetical protein
MCDMQRDYCIPRISGVTAMFATVTLICLMTRHAWMFQTVSSGELHDNETLIVFYWVQRIQLFTYMCYISVSAADKLAIQPVWWLCYMGLYLSVWTMVLLLSLDGNPTICVASSELALWSAVFLMGVFVPIYDVPEIGMSMLMYTWGTLLDRSGDARTYCPCNLCEQVWPLKHEIATPGVTCGICLEEFGENELVIVMDCGHMFHRKEIEEWLRVRKSCPMCRKRATVR